MRQLAPVVVWVAVGLFVSLPVWSQAEGAETDRDALEQRVADLERELAELKQAFAEDAAAEAAAQGEMPPVSEPAESDYPTSDWSGSTIMEYRHVFGPSTGVSGGRFRRLRVAVKGALSDDTTYQVELDGAAGASDLPRKVYIQYRPSRSSTWTLGQFKMPQGYAQLLSRMDQPLPERPLVSENSTWNGSTFYGLAPAYQYGAQYQWVDSDRRYTVQAAVFGGAGRNKMDENSHQDIVLRYQYSSADSRHRAAVSYRAGIQYDGSPGDHLQAWGLEYCYHGAKHWLEAEWTAGQARGDGQLVDSAGGYVQWVYWPDGTSRYGYWPEDGSGDEFWTLRLERLSRPSHPGSRVSLAWLGYTRFIEDDWKAQIALAYQRSEQRLYLTNYWSF